MSPERRHLSLYERALESFARSAVGDWYLKRIARRIDPPLLRPTGGRVSSVVPAPVMLLTTTGVKSGKARTLPLLYVIDGDRLMLIASNYGKKSHRRGPGILGPTLRSRCSPESTVAGTWRARSPNLASAIVPGSSPWTSTPDIPITRFARATATYRCSFWSEPFSAELSPVACELRRFRSPFAFYRLVWGVDLLGGEPATGHPHVNEAVVIPDRVNTSRDFGTAWLGQSENR